MQTSVILVAVLVTVGEAQYLPWPNPFYSRPGLQYQVEGDGEGPDPRPQYPTYPQYRPYLPLPSPDPVLPDPVLELEADPSRPVPQAQPVFSLTDLVLPVQDPQEPVVEQILPVSPPPAVLEPRAPPPPSVSSQYHAQDEFGNHEYGYENVNSAKHEVRDELGVRGSYSWWDEAGHHTVNYVADQHGFRVL